MGLFKKNPFGHILFLKKWLIRILGIMTHQRYKRFNKLEIEGSEIIRTLPENNVLFVSNHQTYFADVMGLYQVFCLSKWGIYDTISNPIYLLNPKLNIYFVAALETMKAGLLPKLFAYVGSVSIKRSWRQAGKEVDRGVDKRDINKIYKALDSGWVITFPQGTTTPYVPGRRGTAHIIKETQPIVIPVVVDGFRRAFDKKGLFLKKKGVKLSITFKEPLKLDYDNMNTRQILDELMHNIEQTEDFNTLKKISTDPVVGKDDIPSETGV